MTDHLVPSRTVVAIAMDMLEKEAYNRGWANGYEHAINDMIPTEFPNEVVIRKWGDIWHMRSDDGSSTSADFLGALIWATADLEPDGPGVLIRKGLPLSEKDRP